ncbi:MAG: hypothetical protein D6689_02135 [Deltaproteobacteria bacterium]|nr:MAG: hypothetical protein D6689_02135 [Deltaproteobacteria bacterium]
MRWFSYLMAVWVAAAACAPEQAGYEETEPEGGWDETRDGKFESMAGPIVVVEVGDDFVELRNDGAAPVDLVDFRVSFSYRRVVLQPHPGRAHVVPPGGLAVVADAGSDVLARLPAWVPAVATSKPLDALLRYSKRLIVRTPDLWVSDRADATEPAAPGVSVERRLKTRWQLSRFGATAGVRNAVDTGRIRTWFALPGVQAANPLPAALAAWIEEARFSLDAALYQIDHPQVVAALADAARRGVRVRVVTDSTYLDDPSYAGAYGTLRAAGVAVVGDGRTARQHNKFLVRDGRWVWTGSYNPLAEDGRGFIAWDNAMSIDSPALAATHAAEVDEMFAGAFGPSKRDGGGHVAYVDGARIEVYFAPTDDPRRHILDAIRGARRSIYFSQFSFYDEEIGAELLAAADRGVDVRGVVDRRSANAATQYGALVGAGLDVRRPYFDALLHNKVIVIDYGTPGATVITGSFNLTAKAATSNDESVVIVRDPQVARDYYAAWRRAYDRSAGPNTDTTGLAPVAISEVFVGEGDDPFVELANLDGGDTPLAGLVLCGRDGGEIALSGAVPAGGRIAVAADGLDLDYADALVVVDGRGRIVTSFDDPAYPGAGRSLEREDVAVPDLDAPWRPSQVEGGTPGW